MSVMCLFTYSKYLALSKQSWRLNWARDAWMNCRARDLLTVPKQKQMINVTSNITLHK